MSAPELVRAFMRATGHEMSCALARPGVSCTCGQVDELKAVRHDASRYLARLSHEEAVPDA